MQLPHLNFPKFEFRFQQNKNGSLQIFDIVRKKFIDLTPEEWVRQNIIHFLKDYRGVPVSMMSVEKQLKLNNTLRRTDIVVFNNDLKPLLIIECKAPEIIINQNTINQALQYNLELKAYSILLSNGLKHTFLKVKPQVEILKDIPNYTELLNF